jgi:hypothetical protein
VSDHACFEWALVDIPRIAETTGILSVVELGAQFDFPVKRAFWVTDVTSETTMRGDHAHGPLMQLLFCTTGSCRIDLETASGRTASLTLASDGPALLLEGRVWRRMTEFKPNTCMMVLCDREYRHDLVVRDYREFKGQ